MNIHLEIISDLFIQITAMYVDLFVKQIEFYISSRTYIFLVVKS